MIEKLKFRPGVAVQDTVKGYCDNSTVAGLSYVSDTTSRVLDRCLWFIVCVIFAVLAIYWSTTAYIDWQDDPVLTTVKTTGNKFHYFDIFKHNYQFNNQFEEMTYSENRTALIVMLEMMPKTIDKRMEYFLYYTNYRIAN